MASNVEILTRSHTIIKAKARAKKNQIDQIVFDEDARREFLTGFRKRNIVKKEAKKAKAIERERQERLEARREHRKALQEQAAQNVKLVESAYRENVNEGSDDDDSEEEFTGFSSAEKGKAKATQEYEDEEQLATVTVVEEFDPDSLKHMPSSFRRSSPGLSDAEGRNDAQDRTSSDPRKSRSKLNRAAEDRPTSSSVRHDNTASAKKKTKVKPKKIAYESKAARKATRVKQRARKAEKAELAGGKAKRKDKGRLGKKSRR